MQALDTLQAPILIIIITARHARVTRAKRKARDDVSFRATNTRRAPSGFISADACLTLMTRLQLHAASARLRYFSASMANVTPPLRKAATPGPPPRILELLACLPRHNDAFHDEGCASR